MIWLWAGLALLVAALGLRRRAEVESVTRPPRLDDDAIRRIVEHGTLTVVDDEATDADRAAREEDERWDEPEEYGR
jgi:hypothetical protein